jgi:transposase
MISASDSFAKRLEKGRLTRPVTEGGTVTPTPTQLSMLLEGLDWHLGTTGA